MRYMITAILAVLLFSVSMLGISYYRVQKENYYLTHTLMECSGRYVVFQGTRDAAIQWAQTVCITKDGFSNWEIVANQDYDDTK